MADQLLSVTGLVAGYRPGLPILRDVSIFAAKGEIVTLIGPNGAGKSTLIKAIAGLVKVDTGAVKLAGKDITNIRPDRLAEHAVAYVPQTANIFAHMTIQQNLVLASQRVTENRKEALARIYTLFPDLEERRTIKAGGLSGGQRQVLAIGMALVSDPGLVLMDEPTAGLSPKAAKEILSLIQSIAAKGVTVILVEQNARAALRISGRAYVLAEGRVQHTGEGASLLNDPVIGDIYLGVRLAEGAS